MPVNSIIIGVDLAPIKPIPKVITFQSDITTEKCRATIKQHLKTWKADTVLHDGAPNVGTAWVQDSYNQAELVLEAMRLATDFLVEGGTFVTKVFRSKDYNSLLWVFNQLFSKVEATKPPSSRNVSAEIFVVCRGFKAPKRIDPRFLDPRAVFAELADPTPNNEAKVYNPEVKKRKRDGYEEGDYTQFKEISASEFIQTTDPIAILGQYNRLSFTQAGNGDVALAALDKLPETTDEIRHCCSDLKVLGRKDFKMLLRWRLRVREIFGFPSKKTTTKETPAEEVAEVEPMDEELKIQEELQAIKEKEGKKKKREKRKENEQKQREIVRMQLNMAAPMDIGMEQAGPKGEGAMFALKSLNETDAMGRIIRGKMTVVKDSEPKADHDGLGPSAGTEDETDEEEDALEDELDGMYDQYKERKLASDARYRAKMAKKKYDDDDQWEGVSVSEHDESDDDEIEEESSGESGEDESNGVQGNLLQDLDGEPSVVDGLSKRARRFFNQDIFKDIPGMLDEDENEDGDQDLQPVTDEQPPKKKKKKTKNHAEFDESKENGFEVVKLPRDEEEDDDDDWEESEKRQSNGKPGKCNPSSHQV
jgi:AdoMet-dependent rRNA methyltransferase SPB1